MRRDHAIHLVRRFFGSLAATEPSEAEEQWVAEVLLPGERHLWARMSAPDRSHALGVARRVDAHLGPERSDRTTRAAALLHDVGKVDSGLGTFGRVAATIVGLAARDRVRTGRGRIARYLRHDQIGGALLERAGSDERTVAWAVEHHLPPGRWSLPLDIATALKEADDD